MHSKWDTILPGRLDDRTRGQLIEEGGEMHGQCRDENPFSCACCYPRGGSFNSDRFFIWLGRKARGRPPTRARARARAAKEMHDWRERVMPTRANGLALNGSHSVRGASPHGCGRLALLSCPPRGPGRRPGERLAAEDKLERPPRGTAGAHYAHVQPERTRYNYRTTMIHARRPGCSTPRTQARSRWLMPTGAVVSS